MPNNQGYDVFISYAHADNEIPQNAGDIVGWVTALAKNLKALSQLIVENDLCNHMISY